MKKLLLICGLLSAMFTTTEIRAQVKVNINIDLQPDWGPYGYDYVNYYYLPDIEMYYCVSKRQYVYFNGGRWIWANSLPSHYRNYDLHRGYKVIINEDNPWRHYDKHKVNYKKYKNHYGKQEIRKNHPSKAKGNNGNGNGNHHDKGNSNKGKPGKVGGQGHGGGGHKGGKGGH